MKPITQAFDRLCRAVLTLAVAAGTHAPTQAAPEVLNTQPLPAWTRAVTHLYKPAEATPEALPHHQQRLLGSIAATPRRGYLYLIERGSQRAFVYGATEWSLPSTDYFPLNVALLECLQASTQVLVGLDPALVAQGTSEALRIGFYGPQDDLSRHIPAELLKRLQVLVQAWGKNASTPLREKPWMMADLITSVDLIQHGWQRELASLNVVVDVARAMNKPVQTTQGWPAHVQLYAAMPEDIQIAYLAHALHGVENARHDELERQRLLAWSQGDTHAWEKTLPPSGPASSDTWLAYRHWIDVVERNRLLMDTMNAPSAQEQVMFVAVPCHSLFGTDGFLSQLKRHGFRVHDIQEPRT